MSATGRTTFEVVGTGAAAVYGGATGVGCAAVGKWARVGLRLGDVAVGGGGVGGLRS